MSTFTPPRVQDVPASLPDATDLANRLARHFASGWRASNVFILDDDTVTTEWPPATYNADGSLDQMPEDRVVASFYGGTHTVTDAQAALLTAAGYEVDG